MRTELVKDLIDHRNPDRAIQMEKYMRNQFHFLGIQSPMRRQISIHYLNEKAREPEVDWSLVEYLWNQPYREGQYIACDYLLMIRMKLVPDDIPALKQLALKKSWWDTIDVLDKVIGGVCLLYPALNTVMIKWSTDRNIWLRRIAIDHQRHRKEQTDTELLETILLNNFGTTEFFITKAIGWSLRDYSKTDPMWVRQFIHTHQKDMHPLSIREGSKYLS